MSSMDRQEVGPFADGHAVAYARLPNTPEENFNHAIDSLMPHADEG